jgi:hypothetical protein
MACSRCHGSHFVRNPAWSDRVGPDSPEREETYARQSAEEVEFTRLRGPELLPCPACAPQRATPLATPPRSRRRPAPKRPRAQMGGC